MDIKIGILGCGWITEHAHIPSLSKINSIKLTALFDIDINRAQRMCDKFQIENAYDMLEDFMNSGINAAVIATPNFTHADYSKKLIEHGIHVLCEKPVALSEKDISEICALADQNDIVYMPGFVNRWRTDIQMISSAVSSGKAGNIIEIQAGWIRKNGVPRPGTWFTKRSLSGGGVLVDLGSHILDICLMFMGNRKAVDYKCKTSLCSAEILQKSGAANWFRQDYISNYEIDVEDNAEVYITFEDKTKIKARLSWRAETESDYTYFKLIGNEGTIELKTLFGFSNERLWKKDQLIFDCNGIHENICLNREKNNTKNAFDKMHTYFVQSIKNKTTSYINCSDAIRTVSLIENLYKNENH